MVARPKHTSSTIVDLGAALIGHLDTDQSLYVHGVFEGDLQVTKTVFIDIEGQVSADVTAERVVVRGTVIGNISAEQVIIHANGKVWGDVCAQALYVETGGVLRGQVIISHESEPKLYPRTELLDDFDIATWQSPLDDDLAYPSVEQEAVVAPDSLFANNGTNQPTHADVEQKMVQQDVVQNEPGETQATDDIPFTANPETIQRQTEQIDTQLTETETETMPLPVDLETSQDEIAQQEQTYTAYCLICRAYRPIEGAHQVTLPNGHLVVKGHCAVCGIRFMEQIHLE